jgi:hypothetical protein
MFSHDIKIFPLICGAYLGAYILALVGAVYSRWKSKKAGIVISKSSSLGLSSIFLAAFVPAWMIFMSKAYFSAALGSICGIFLFLCVSLIFTQRKKHA